MVTPAVIKALYKTYPQPPKDINKINFGILKQISQHHKIEINETEIHFTEFDEETPFHKIPKKNITSIIDNGLLIYIVLRNSILFINKNTGDINVHIKINRPTIFERLKQLFSYKQK